MSIDFTSKISILSQTRSKRRQIVQELFCDSEKSSIDSDKIYGLIEPSELSIVSFSKNRKCNEFEKNETNCTKSKVSAISENIDLDFVKNQKNDLSSTSFNTKNYFQNTFNVKSFLGKGSYGVVYRCVHKIDLQEYALKIVKLPKSLNGQIDAFNEAKTLAKVSNHKNILRYYNSWVESFDPQDHQLLSLLSGNFDSSDSNNIQKKCPIKSTPPFLRKSQIDNNNTPKLSDIIFRDDNATRQRRSLPSSKTNRSIESLSIGNQNSRCLLKKSSFSLKKEVNLLFIQMECPQKTLKEFMDMTCKKLLQTDAIEIFHQIVKAVEHTHISGYVHRDVSSRNIFINTSIDGKYSVLLGDFGSAVPINKVGAEDKVASNFKDKSLDNCKITDLLKQANQELTLGFDSSYNSIQKFDILINRSNYHCGTENPQNVASKKFSLSEEMSSSINSLNESAPFLFPIGTPGYSPPEFNGKATPFTSIKNRRSSTGSRNCSYGNFQENNEPKMYSPAIDIFSLSVILLELLYHFSTQMERAHLLMRWKDGGILPDSFITNHPIESDLLRKCGSHDPGARPKACELSIWCAKRLKKLKSDALIKNSSNEADVNLKNKLKKIGFYRSTFSNNFEKKYVPSDNDSNANVDPQISFYKSPIFEYSESKNCLELLKNPQNDDRFLGLTKLSSNTSLKITEPFSLNRGYGAILVESARSPMYKPFKSVNNFSNFLQFLQTERVLKFKKSEDNDTELKQKKEETCQNMEKHSYFLLFNQYSNQKKNPSSNSLMLNIRLL